MWLAPWLVGSIVVGCADPEGAYDDFIDRRAVTGVNNAANKCRSDKEVETCSPPTQASVEAGYYFTLAANLLPTKPYVALATVDLDEAAQTITITIQPLRADDRKTPVGNAFTGGPFPVEDDGSFVGDFGEVTMPGATNPISGRDLVTTLILVGAPNGFCEESGFVCGSVEGKATKPITLDLETSTFTLQRFDKFKTIPEPLLDCACSPADPI